MTPSTVFIDLAKVQKIFSLRSRHFRPRGIKGKSMKVEVRLYASLRNYLPANAAGNTSIVEIAEGSTIRELFRKLHMPPDAPKIIFLNGLNAQGDEVLKEGDRVGAFPPVAGG